MPSVRALVIIGALLASTFVITNPLRAATYPTLVYSSSANHSQSANLDGSTLSGSVYIWVNSVRSGSSVSFWLDDPQRATAPISTTKIAPYDMLHDASGAVSALDTTGLANGKHTITMRVTWMGLSPYTKTATVTVSNGSEMSLFGNLKPTSTTDPDPNGVELGVRFSSDVAGTVTGVRFYKSTQNVGTHTGHVWSSSGALLASTTFTNETASGWQISRFSTPLAVTPGQTYVVSYYTPTGYYAADTGWFQGKSQNNGVLHAPADSASTPDGLYAYGSASQFPTNTWQSANYYVDLLFIPSSTNSQNTSVAPTTTTTVQPSVTSTTAAPTTTVPATTSTTLPPAPAPATSPTTMTGWPSAANTGDLVGTTRTMPGAAITSRAWFAANGFPGSGTASDPYLIDRVLFTSTVTLGDWDPTDLSGAWVKFTNDRFLGNPGNPTPAGSSYLWARDTAPFFIVEDSTLGPDQAPLATGGTTMGTDKGIFSYVPFQLRRSNVYGANVLVGFETELNETTGILLEDNYLHDIWSASGDHTDIVNGNFHASHVTVRHNMLDGIRVGGTYVTNGIGIYDDPVSSSAGLIEDWTIDGNYIDRAATMVLSTTDTSRFAAPFVVTNNVFTNRYTVGRFIARTPTTQSGNVDQNSAPLVF